MYRLKTPLYHGTSAASAYHITHYLSPFDAPLYLTEHKEMALHYAQCATAYISRQAQTEGVKLLADGYALFTFHSLPNKDYLVPDDYNENAEPDQFKYLKPLKGISHYTLSFYPFEYNEREHLHLVSYAMGMWAR